MQDTLEKHIDIKNVHDNQTVNDLLKEIKELKAKIALQDIALNSAINSTVITDAKGNIKWVNKAFISLTGYQLDEVVGKNPRILKSGKHDKQFYKEMWGTIKSGKTWEGEITNKKKNGVLYHEKIVISPVFDLHNNIINYIAVKQDITNLKTTDDTLNELYIKYEELAYIFNQSPAIGFLWNENQEKNIEFITENIKQWGYIPEEFYTQKLNFTDIIFIDDRQKFISEIVKIIKLRKDRLKLEFRIVTKSGRIRWVVSHLYVRFGENDSVTHIQGVALDVTDRKLAEEESKMQLEQLMQADKMIALGTLVSGVAHEINNPNNFVMLNIPIIEKVWFSTLPILEEYYSNNGDFNVGERLMFSKIKDSMPLLLAGIINGTKRIKNIVQDLKNFARKDSSGYNQLVDINKVVQTSVNLTANLVSKSTDNFSVNYSKDPIFVRGNKQKLEQVLINLIENSCQALSDRSKKIRLGVEKKANSASIYISDEGHGMKPDLVRKITDPFFTTKRNKGGTGLGLSIASKIIMQHKGVLNFSSTPNVGTIATITLPFPESE